MLKIDDIIKDTRLPSPLRTGETLEQNRNLEIQKIFPLIGLKNCREETPLKIHSEVLPFARHLLNGMYANFVYAIRDATYTCMDFRHQHRYAEADGIDRQILLMKKVRDFLVRAENQDRCISPNSTGTITLNLPITISLQQEERGEHGEEAIFKAGEGLIKVYGKIRSELLKNSCYVLGDIAQTTFFKNFSSANVPGGSYQTVFSSDGEEGAWDLATMSMRGINSCQSWTNSNSRSLTGSIIDPFTGIIYMTNGKKFEGRGDKMLRRCLVRFMINGPKKEPFLSLERMYPDYSPEIAKTFTDFLQKRTKIPVIDFSNRNYDTKPAGCYIPKSSLTNKIKVAKSYVDSGVTYRSYGSSPAVNPTVC